MSRPQIKSGKRLLLPRVIFALVAMFALLVDGCAAFKSERSPADLEMEKNRLEFEVDRNSNSRKWNSQR